MTPDTSAEQFGIQVAALRPDLFRYAKSLTHSADAADDLAHDTIVRALARRHLFEQGTSLRKWLITILHNLFINGAKRKSRLTNSLDDVPEAVRGVAQNDGPARLEVGDVDRALEALPANLRQILIALEELSYEEVAVVLGAKMGTVKSRLARARVRIAQELGGRAELSDTPPGDEIVPMVGALPEAKVIARYLAGESSGDLARATGYSAVGVLYRLRRAGVQIRPRHAARKAEAVSA